MSTPDPLLRIEGVCRSFYGVEVLHGVSVQLQAGRILGLLGENGAGKSTLMNIVGGTLPPDQGQLFLNGEIYAPKNARDAEAAGIAFIHQELNLFPALSIAENLFISDFPRRRGLRLIIDTAAMRRETQVLLARVGLDLPADTPVDRLRSGERQLVEIAKALRSKARLIIFDEPTTSLAQGEVDRLFKLINELRTEGIACIFISHNLEHALHLCDDFLVLRDGTVVSHGPSTAYTIDTLVAQMVGRPINQLFPTRTANHEADVVLAVRELSHPYVLHRVSFELHRGEVLGIGGLLGSGRTELLRALFGLDPCDAGDVLLNGRSLRGFSNQDRLSQGMALLTEDRRNEGLAMDASIADNLTLVALRRFARGPLGLLDRAAREQAIGHGREQTRINPGARNEQPVRTLSGGNQQKVVLARWLLNDPEILMLDEPTRGIDIGAKSEIYTLIQQLSARGQSVIVVSSEIEELIGLCDRILMMRRGEICGSVPRAEFDREHLLKIAFVGSTA